jgi:hypothetical protein
MAAACANGSAIDEAPSEEPTALPTEATSPGEAGSTKADAESSGQPANGGADAKSDAPRDAGGTSFDATANDGAGSADAGGDVIDAAFVDADDAGATTFSFPTANDTAVIVTNPYMWNQGDRYEGSRATTLAQATSLTGNFDVVFNRLSPCGVLSFDVSLNGTKIGSAYATPMTGSVALSFQFPPIAGPVYTLRYEVSSTVPNACGSAWFSTTSSSVTLR